MRTYKFADQDSHATRAGFTLIELLIVVAIIAILAAIAVPNFLEAQTRAKVSRVKSDMRTAKTALESYAVDRNAYPILRLYRLAGDGRQFSRGGIFAVTDLTTPVAYLTTVYMPDPFFPNTSVDQYGDIPHMRETQGQVSRSLNYVNTTRCRAEAGREPIRIKYYLQSYGPDKVRGPIPGVSTPYLGTYCSPYDPDDHDMWVGAEYDASNGTISGGDILDFQD